MPTQRLNKPKCGMATALLAIAALVAGVLLRSEPAFEGKSLSYWLDQLPSIDIGVDGRGEAIPLPGWYQTFAEADADQSRVRSNITQACKALDTINTNDLSLLVARLQAKDSRAMSTVWDWADRMGIIHDAEIHSAQFRCGQSLQALSYLGARARPVVPQLLDLTTNQDANTQLLAWSALERVAPDEFHAQKHPPIIQHVSQ